MKWLVKYTFAPDRAEEFAWDPGQQSYEELLEDTRDLLYFLGDFSDSITSVSMIAVPDSCSLNESRHPEAPFNTMFGGQSAESLTEKSYPGHAATLVGEVNSRVGIAMAVVLSLISLAVAILVMLLPLLIYGGP